MKEFDFVWNQSPLNNADMQFLQDPIITSTISLTNMNLEYFMGGAIF